MKECGTLQSVDTSSGWITHFDSMIRWQTRAEETCSGGMDDGINAIQGMDFALAFVVWAHSLREWLINDEAVDQAELDKRLQQYETWKMCRDLANRTRHLDLKTRPKDKYWSINRSFGPNSDQLEGTREYRWCLTYDGQTLEVLNAIYAIRSMWDDVLIELGKGNWVEPRRMDS